MTEATTEPDVLVVGGGISGASFAWHAARAGRRVLVLDREARAGGCIASVSAASGFWYELGAHTCYNSYGAFLEVLEGCDLLSQLQPRGRPVLRFLRGDRLVAGKNLLLLLRLFSKLELLRSIPGWFGGSREGATVRAHYSRFVGPGNYDRVLGPMLSAVPSQEAHDFPADMLFKKRERRKDVLRSFTLPGGLRTAVDRMLARPGIRVATERRAIALARGGRGFVVTCADGAELSAPVVALAVPPGEATALLGDPVPAAAAAAGGIGEARVDSTGFVVARSRVAHVPYSTFLIPLQDEFHSIVTRDVVPDDEWRGFTFHFRPGRSRDDRVRRACQVLQLQPADLQCLEERHTVLPSPRPGHGKHIAELDRALAGETLAVTGNWFGGLSIEDCVLRSRAEWRRVSAR